MPCNYSLDFPTQQYLQHLHDTVICFWHRTYIKWPPSSKRHYFSLVNEVTVFTRSWYGLAYITTSCVCVSFCVGVRYWYAVNKCINWSSWFFGVTVAKDEIYFALHGSRNQHNKKDISPRGCWWTYKKFSCSYTTVGQPSDCPNLANISHSLSQSVLNSQTDALVAG